MAISHVQPLLLLIGSLFFLPALHAVDFEYCNESGYEFGNVTRVEISPNPVGPDDYELSITVFGYANKAIDFGSVEVYAKSENITDLLRRESCAIEAGTNFVLPLSEVPKDVLEGDYKYVVALLDGNVGDSKEANAMGRESPRQETVTGGWNDKTSKTCDVDRNREQQENLGSIYQDQRVQPCHLSSSIYYGGPDVYYQPQNPSINSTNKKDGGEDDSGSASRGNWWQGSLYY